MQGLRVWGICKIFEKKQKPIKWQQMMEIDGKIIQNNDNMFGQTITEKYTIGIFQWGQIFGSNIWSKIELEQENT